MIRKAISVAILLATVGAFVMLFIEATRPIEPEPLPQKETDERVELLASVFNASPLDDEKKLISSAINSAVETFENVSPEEKKRNATIVEALKTERLELIKSTVPSWVSEHLRHAEEQAEFGNGYESSIAWGTGVYRDATFYWYAYAGDSDYGALQLDLATRLRQDEVMRLRGLKPNDLELAEEVGNDVFDVLPSNDVYHEPDVITRLRYNEETSVDWIREFCVQPDTNVCDTVGALEKYVLPKLRELVPEMKFEMKGRFPKLLH